MADRDIGIALIVVGVIMMAIGIIFPPVCGIGILLLIVGVILMAVSSPQPVYYTPYPYGTAPMAPAGVAAPAAPACPVCGSALTWVAQYNRWYCYRCQAYR